MRKKTNPYNFFAVKAKRLVKDGQHTCVGLWVYGNGYQGERSTLAPGSYYCDDGGEIPLIVTFLGGSWEIYHTGQTASFAVSSEGVKIRALKGLKVASLALQMGEETPCDELEEAGQVYMVAARYRDTLARLCGNPENGVTAVIRHLAPELANVRRHEGMNILARREVLRGGRNEVFGGLSNEHVTQYDMRSAYAWGYGEAIPGRFLAILKEPPKGDCFIAKVTVTVPSSQWIPPVPFRAPSGSLVFPTGEWETFISGPEYRMIEPSGMIARVHKVYSFEPVDVLRDFANKLFALRMTTDCPVEKELAKSFLVTAYGILGTQAVFPKTLIRPNRVPAGAQVIRPGVYRVLEKPRVNLSHVPAAAYVASKVRARLWAALSTCGLDGPGGESAYYCDTDSVFLSSSASAPFPLGEGAGQWRPVGTYGPGSKWVAPKTYSLGGGAVLKASGVAIKEAARYLAGETISTRKITGLAHVLDKGYASEIPVTVTLRQQRDSKRAVFEGYRTRPLTIDEAKGLQLWLSEQISRCLEKRLLLGLTLEAG